MLIADGLTKKYGDFSAVQNLSFEVKEGSIFGFLGHNGAGKTTTISMLTTLILPTSGTASIDGYNVKKDNLKVRNLLGYLPEIVIQSTSIKFMEVFYMRKRYTTEQKQELVRKYYAGESVSVICLKNDIPRSTFYTWIKPYKVVGTVLEYEINAVNYARQKKRIIKLENMIEVLQIVECSISSPLQVKLKELEKLYGKYSVHVLCDSLEIARGTFYNHIFRNKKDNNSYQKRREELSKLIREIFEKSNQIYGARKIKAVLNIQGVNTTDGMVSELMQYMNLQSVRGETKRQYTRFKHELKKDVLKLNFSAKAPNQVWVSDVTYFRVCNNTRYICVIIDLFSRKVIGYKTSQKHSTQLITSTFKIAYQDRKPGEDLVFHSDRGVQYTAFAFRELLKTLQITQSFSPSGSPCHNAVMESFFATLKREELYRIKYRSIREFEQSIGEYIERYNNERPHITLRYKTPNAFEQAHCK